MTTSGGAPARDDPNTLFWEVLTQAAQRGLKPCAAVTLLHALLSVATAVALDCPLRKLLDVPGKQLACDRPIEEALPIPPAYHGPC